VLFSPRAAHFRRARAAQRTRVELALIAEVRNGRRKNAKKEWLEKTPLFRKSAKELEPNSNLALASRQTLKGAAKDRRSTIETLHSSDITFIEEIEEFHGSCTMPWSKKV